LGAFYYFFINAVFISLATYTPVRHLHFPRKEFTIQKLPTYTAIIHNAQHFGINASKYHLYSVYKDELTKKEIQQFVLEPNKKNCNEILEWEVTNRAL
jgi:hypothetical protein